MGNEVSRPAGDGALSPPSMGAGVPPTPPYTPTGGTRAHSFTSRSPSPTPVNRRASSSSNMRPPASPAGIPKMDRSIQRMDKAIRRRVRGGITYNMKLLLRGAKGTGKTSLFQRLKGEPIPEAHVPTPQLQSATIKWQFRANSEENVKCEVWDVVDRGFLPSEAETPQPDASSPNTSTESVTNTGLSAATAAEAAVMASAASVTMNGAHSVAVVDASTVDVYQEANGVIFLLDVTKWDTLEYVKQQLDAVPVHIPTLVLGNFRDCGAQRKIFKEDIQELLYGSPDRPQPQQWRRPHELLYFECSLLNCYGLKSLHQYLGIPFLQLKLSSLRQKLRLVEGEFAHLKHDLQANISDSRYVDYVEHIKATGSDIRTGRRAVAGVNGPRTPPGGQNPTKGDVAPRENEKKSPSESEGKTTRRPSGSGRNGGDVVIDRMASTAGAAAVEMPPLPLPTAVKDVAEEETKPTVLDAEDLPERSSSVVLQAASALKFAHQESSSSSGERPTKDSGVETKSESAVSGEGTTASKTGGSNANRPRKTSVGEVMDLTDFQVPKLPKSELDHFYSEDESEEEDAGDDEDVVVAAVGLTGKKTASSVYHKQRFLDSDSEEDEDEVPGRSKKKGKPTRTSSVKNSSREAKVGTQTTVEAVSSAASVSATQTGLPSRPQPSKGSPSPRRTSSLKQMVGATSTSTGSPPAAASTPTPPASPPKSPPSASVRRTPSPRVKADQASSAPVLEPPVTNDNAETKTEAHASEGESAEEAVAGKDRSSSLSGRESLRQLSQQRREQTSTSQSSQEGGTCGHEANHVEKGTTVDLSTSSPTVQVVASQGEDAESEDGVLVQAEDHESATSAEEQSGEIEAIDITAASDDLDAGAAATSKEMKSFFSDEEDEDVAVPQQTPVAVDTPASSISATGATTHRPEMIESDEEDEVDARLGSVPDLSSSSALQASLPLPPSTSSPSPRAPTPSLSSGPVSFPPVAAPVVPNVVATNDLEAFLNDSDSDSDVAAPAPASAGDRTMTTSHLASDEEDDAAEARFASYSVSKKSKAERRRQQREELRQLNAALDKSPWEEEQSELASSQVSVLESAANDDVLAAIRKAQEEALRMLPATADDDAVSSVSSTSRHMHKKAHKKKSKDKDGDATKDGKKSRKSSRKSGSSSRSKSRRAGHGGGDMA